MTETFGEEISKNKERVEISVKTLIEAGAHYGHQTERWNPKMLPFIFGERNGVHILNLDITLRAWKRAAEFIAKTVADGGSALFVGTKLQARDLVKEAAERCGAYYITARWLGGTLTNFETIKRSLDRIRKIEDLLTQAEDPNSKVRISKKEKLDITRQLEKLLANLGGIRGMKRAPEVMFVIDLNKEHIAIQEARRLGIPIVALVDTNCDPDVVDYPIPSNDDAARTLQLFLDGLVEIINDARQVYAERAAKGEIAGETDAAPRRGRRERRGSNDEHRTPQENPAQA